MNELFLYDRDRGLFKEIVKQSAIMEGRYYVSTDAENINTGALDALGGLTVPAQKYPLVLCLPPTSAIVYGGQYIDFVLYFLTRHGVTGQNKLKVPQAATQTSGHPYWLDWYDMARCATGFLDALCKVPGANGIPLVHAPENSPITITRLTHYGTDNINGVRLSFQLYMGIECYPAEYDNMTGFVMPEMELHPAHKH